MSTRTQTSGRLGRGRSARAAPTIRVLWSPDRPTGGAATPLPAGSLVIGREPRARHTLVLDDPCMSRTHASIHNRGGRLVVADNGSHNGTGLNGAPIERAALADGDLIRVGDTFLLVRTDGGADAPMPELLGDAPSMRALRRTLAAVAESDASVVLSGESGSGKGQSARAIHRLSGRPGPLITVNCAAIPEHLAESVLFGHVQGAFTGANRSSEGFFRGANGGTLFIDEIGDLPRTLQPKLLHAIEEREVIPVGATRPVPVDVRYVTATHLDLERAVQEGAFRGDLYMRLAEITIALPPLRDRREDVMPLLMGFLAGAPPLDPELVEALLLRPWPYNVRQLRNVATSLRIRSAGAEIISADLLDPTSPEPLDGAHPDAQPPRSPGLEDLEAALRAHRGVVSETARALGLSRRHLYRLMKRHDVDPDSFR